MNYIDHASVKRETTELCHSLEKSQMSYAEPKTPNSKGTTHCSILSDILEDPKLEGTLNIEQTLLVLGVGDRDQRQRKEALESDKTISVLICVVVVDAWLQSHQNMQNCVLIMMNYTVFI